MAVAKLQISEGYESRACGSIVASGVRNTSGVQHCRPNLAFKAEENASLKSLRLKSISDNVKSLAFFPSQSTSTASDGILGINGWPSPTDRDRLWFPYLSYNSPIERSPKVDGTLIKMLLRWISKLRRSKH